MSPRQHVWKECLSRRAARRGLAWTQRVLGKRQISEADAAPGKAPVKHCENKVYTVDNCVNRLTPKALDRAADARKGTP